MQVSFTFLNVYFATDQVHVLFVFENVLSHTYVQETWLLFDIFLLNIIWLVQV